MIRYCLGLAAGAAMCLVGCSATDSGKQASRERGPQGTVAYKVLIETSEPGVKIEANNEFLGVAPLELKIFGDKDGTFHNFGSQEYVIRAYPANTNQTMQTKIFRTGGWFSQEDQIPKRIYFDMKQPSGSFSIDLPPKY
jgi:hypothetical protein